MAPTDAGALFERGTAAYLRGDYSSAVDAFSQAYRETGRKGLLFSIGQAYRREHEARGGASSLKAALRYYAQYLQEDPKGERSREARELMERLAALPEARGWDEPAVQSEPPTPPRAEPASEAPPPERSFVTVLGHVGSELLIDGVPVGVLPQASVAVAAGEHTIELRKRGFFGVRRQLRVREGERLQLRLEAPATTLRTVSIGAVVGGSASLVAGGVLAGLALHEQSRALELQGDAAQARDYNAALKSRNDLRLAAAITAGVGAIATSAGVYGLLSEGFGPTLDVSASSVDAASSEAGPSTRLVSLRLRF